MTSFTVPSHRAITKPGYLKQLIHGRLVEHHRYIGEPGGDPPEMKAWKRTVPA